MSARRVWIRGALALAPFLSVFVAAFPAEAQQILARPPSQNDKVRLSGFVWRGKGSGLINFGALAAVPGLEGGIDIVDTLGLTEAENGWILEGNFAAGRRHRFIFEYSRQENSGEAAISLTGIGGGLVDLVVAAQTTIGLREMHGYYNFLFVARPQVEFGLIGGIGYFDVRTKVTSPVAAVTGQLDQAFPTLGANLLINPQGPVRGYVELTGFPRIDVDELSGSQLDLVTRLEVFVASNFGLLIGYRRYRLVFDHDVQSIGLETMWDGFTFGGQLRF